MASWEELLVNDYFAWGLLPFVGVNVAYFGTALMLELAIRTRLFPLIVYGNETSRLEVLDEFYRNKISFATQLKGGAWQMLGPTAILSCFVTGWAFPLLLGPITTPYPTIQTSLIHFVILEIVGDFFLYWGHRIQHESEFLWRNFHYFHHQISTPSPISTVFIDKNDILLQASLPMMCACLLVKPHPTTFALYASARVCENTLNHSGIQSALLDVITLKCLPLRAPIRHHDQHHRFCNYAGKAKNYGENFWIWDWMFGTMREAKGKTS